MTTEEKAKRYDKALESIKELYSKGSRVVVSKEEFENIFPELAESEDERMRKTIINTIEDCSPILSPEVQKRMIAWLEKQGDTNETIDRDKLAQGVLRGAAINLITWIDYNAAEGNMCLSNVQCKEIENALVNGDWNKIYAYMKKKLEKRSVKTSSFDFNPVDWQPSEVDGKIHNIYNVGVEPKFEPKFQNGQWIVWQDKCYKVNCNGCGYELIDQNGLSTSLEYGTVDESAHVWTIADAKDGDVLASELCDSIILFKGIKNGNIDFHCDYDFSEIDVPGDRFSVNNGQHYGNVEDSKDFHPATKKQRDTLMKAISDAGYAFDFEKKELKKIEDEEYNGEDYGIDSLFHAQRILEKTLGKVDGYQTDDGILSHECAITAVKKLYEKKPVEWSKEDEVKINRIVSCLENLNVADNDILLKDVNWLKSIKQRMEEQQ